MMALNHPGAENLTHDIELHVDAYLQDSVSFTLEQIAVFAGHGQHLDHVQRSIDILVSEGVISRVPNSDPVRYHYPDEEV